MTCGGGLFVGIKAWSMVEAVCTIDECRVKVGLSKALGRVIRLIICFFRANWTDRLLGVMFWLPVLLHVL